DLVLHVLDPDQVAAIATLRAPVELKTCRKPSMHSQSNSVDRHAVMVKRVAQEKPKLLVVRQIDNVEPLPGNGSGDVLGNGENAVDRVRNVEEGAGLGRRWSGYNRAGNSSRVPGPRRVWRLESAKICELDVRVAQDHFAIESLTA